MKRELAAFLVEEWMNEHEETVEYNLGETCVDSLSLHELLELSDSPQAALDSMTQLRLAYVPIRGSLALRQAISELYRTIQPDQVIPAHGAIGANHQVLSSALSPGDNLVTIVPTYQQHVSIPESLGVEVRQLWLQPEQNYRPDFERLAALVDEDTRMISFINPNNPTGARMSLEELEQMVAIADSVGAYILSDEVYRGLESDDEPSVADLYERAISVGSMSKVYALAGLRLGWIATRDATIMQAILRRRDYDTISCGVLDDYLAALALTQRDPLMQRNRAIVHHNRGRLKAWVEATPGVTMTGAEAGTTALIYYAPTIDSYTFCEQLIEQYGVLVTPGAAFGLEQCFRIGYAYDSTHLMEGLERIGQFVAECDAARI